MGQGEKVDFFAKTPLFSESKGNSLFYKISLAIQAQASASAKAW